MGLNSRQTGSSDEQNKFCFWNITKNKDLSDQKMHGVDPDQISSVREADGGWILEAAPDDDPEPTPCILA